MRADHGMGSGKLEYPGRPPQYIKGQLVVLYYINCTAGTDLMISVR